MNRPGMCQIDFLKTGDGKRENGRSDKKRETGNGKTGGPIKYGRRETGNGNPKCTGITGKRETGREFSKKNFFTHSYNP
jgi:hypothetical protein